MSLARKASLLAAWTRVRLLIYLRTPRAAFFTFVFPLLLLLLLNSVNGGVDVTSTTTGEKVPFATYFTPSIAIFALITGCYTGIIFAVSTARDRGIIKRVVGTPLPSPVFLASWACSSIITGFASVFFLIVIGIIAFDVSIEPQLIPAAAVAILLGGLCLSSLGLAVVSFIRKAESAPAVSNITMFPVIFLSGVFFPIGDAPQWIQDFANVFPVAHLVDAFTGCFDPGTTGSGFTSDYWALVIWTAIGLAVATRRFRVEMTAAGGDRGRPASA
jgi:ABC-2 type transport system permease protein